MKGNNKYGLQFTHTQRNGIFVLLSLLLVIQFLIYFARQITPSDPSDPEVEKWLAQQTIIDSLKKEKHTVENRVMPFNPNFISDYKGFVLGMTVAEIDRLHAFRAEGKYVNSVSEFQKVTGIDKERLAQIAPYFKFPDWVNKRESSVKIFPEAVKRTEEEVAIDINVATQAELMAISGIGAILADRILKEKGKFGAFVSTDQFRYIWGLSEEVIEQLTRRFPVIHSPQFVKTDINNASLKELARFPYFSYTTAKAIITYRSMNGPIKTKEDLTKIKEFPVEKVDIIALYLDF